MLTVKNYPSYHSLTKLGFPEVPQQQLWNKKQGHPNLLFFSVSVSHTHLSRFVWRCLPKTKNVCCFYLMGNLTHSGCQFENCKYNDLENIADNIVEKSVSHVWNSSDDTNDQNFTRSTKKLNKKVNSDLKNLDNWLTANKTCLLKTLWLLFYWRGSTASRLERLWGGSSLFTTKSQKIPGIKFPEIPGLNVSKKKKQILNFTLKSMGSKYFWEIQWTI